MGNAQNRERGVGSSAAVSPSTRASAADSAFSFDQHQQQTRARRGSVGLPDEDPLVLPLHRRRASEGVEPTVAPVLPPPLLLHQNSMPAQVPSRPGPAAAVLDGRTPDSAPLLPVVIQWKKGGQDVQLCGAFTNWRPIPMVRSETNIHGEHMSIVNLPAGRHEYKFFVDGEWVVDSGEPTAVTETGDRTNFITVQPADFAACEALNLETVAGAGREVSGSPPGQYGRQMPAGIRGGPAAAQRPPAPPALPPHLLQVILNKDTPVSCEPTLLPAPNHVMLNHLYALSIKDGVMVLSATHRYRKKYVTTLLYKPI